MTAIPAAPHATGVARVDALDDLSMEALCQATEEAILDGNGFGWLKPPPRHVLERYWRGVLLVPERDLFIARLDGQVAGSGQLLKPSANNEAQRYSATLTTLFVAPFAREHGLARALVDSVEDSARAQGFKQLDLDVRATQSAAILLYEHAGFTRWATKPRYAYVDGAFVPGYFYTKYLDDGAEPAAT